MPLAPAGGWCGLTGARTAYIFGQFIEENELGAACCNDTFVLIRHDPPRVRGADFCYWPRSAVPPEGMPIGVLETPPELCVEMRSPTYDLPHIFGKVADYLSAGVKVVVVLGPFTKTASVYHPDSPPQALTGTDTLTIPDVFPDFSVSVARFFDR